MINIGYDPWARNQPFYSQDSEFEARCGALTFDGLYNYPCYFRLPFICENEGSKYFSILFAVLKKKYKDYKNSIRVFLV